MKRIRNISLALGSIICSLSLFVTLPFPLFAQDNDEELPSASDEKKQEKPSWFGFEAGMSGNYAKGAAPASFDWGPFGNIFFKHQYFRFTFGISRTQDYQLASGSGMYETVNFTTPSIKLSLFPHKVIELYGGFVYSTGDKSHYYKVVDGNAGFNIELEPVSIGLSVGKSNNKYRFKSDDGYDFLNYWSNYASSHFPIIRNLAPLLAYNAYKKTDVKKTEGRYASATLGVRVHQTTTIDAGYDYSRSDMKYLVFGNREKTNIYYSHTGKIGVLSEPVEFFSFNVGVNLGTDNEDYLIAGCDIGISFFIFDAVSLEGGYSPAHYQPPPSKTYSRKTIQLWEAWAIYNLVKWQNINPTVKLSNISKPYWNHEAKFSVSYGY